MTAESRPPMTAPECSTCGGEPCPDCDGTGIVAEEHDYASEPLGCHTCFDEPCPDCGLFNNDRDAAEGGTP